MKVIKCDLPAEIGKLEFIPLADLHMGDACCNFKLIQGWIDYIRNTEHAYCALNGDLMDTAIALSVGDTYGAKMQPMEQLKQCVSIFEPIKHKILCIDPGNHENRVYKQDGIDITALFASQLGLSHLYTNTTALLFIRFGREEKHDRKMCYTAYITHGSGGGRKEGGKINRLSDLASIVDADVYIHSHTHLPAAFRDAYFRVNTGNSSVQKVDKLFVNTAAMLEYGGYGDAQGFKPSSTETPSIFLFGGAKRMKAWV